MPSFLAKNSNITKFVVERGGGELLAFEILNRLDLWPRGDDGAPEIEQVEQVLHLDAARVREADGEHGGAAADLELAGVELRRVGVRRALDEIDIESMRGVELLRLDHRRHEGAKRREAENHDGDFRRRLRGGRGRYANAASANAADALQRQRRIVVMLNSSSIFYLLTF